MGSLTATTGGTSKLQVVAYTGGIAAYAEALYEMTISNCFAASTQYGRYDCAGIVVAFARGVTVKNSYHTSELPFGDYKNDMRTDDVCRADHVDIACGDVTWWLNNESVNGVWKQTLGVDNYPNFTGEDVAEGSSGYYNSSHIWENGVCTDCGKKCTHNFGADDSCAICGMLVRARRKRRLHDLQTAYRGKDYCR